MIEKTKIINVMSSLLKSNNRSFHHRIREVAGGYFDQRHFLGIDPFDHTKFKEDYQKGKQKAVKK